MICEFCNTKLVTFKYNGYYDSFYGWKCGCAKLPQQEDSKLINGSWTMNDEWDDE